jgi:RNA polymerase sigma-70 factor (ECF subfamily)
MLVNSMSDAEDIVQESFYRIWKTRDSLQPDRPVDSYLFITVRNSCLNFLEHRKAVSRHAKIMSDVYTGSSDDNSSYELLVAKDLETEFNEALDKLPPECRRIFELSRFEGLKNTEIAARLDISIKTVENQMTRALYKIRLRLKPYLVSVNIFVSVLFGGLV